jgi:Domain of unknown function (DUF5979)
VIGPAIRFDMQSYMPQVRTAGCAVMMCAALWGVGTTQQARAEAAIALPALRLELVVEGQSQKDQLPIELSCTIAGSRSFVTQQFLVSPGRPMVVGPAEFPGLTTADLCRARASLDGAQTSFLSTQPALRDGTSAPSLGGNIATVNATTTYGSALAQANGQTITVTHAVVGDLLVTKVVDGAPQDTPGAASLRYSLDVVCSFGPANSDSSYLTVDLYPSESRLITGLLVGSLCTVTEPATPGVRFSDSSEIPTDGIVMVTPSPARCWDLRQADATCRSSVIAMHTYGDRDRARDGSTQSVPDTAPDTKPAEDDQAADRNNKAVMQTAAPVAGAPVEEPVELAEQEETVG